MHPLPISLPTCCRTLAVSSGKVITSATQAANPAEKILTPMVGCASAAVAPSILAQIAERGAGAEEKAAVPKVEVQFSLPLYSRPLGQQPALSPGEPGGWQPGGPGGHSREEERRSGAGWGSASLPTFSPGTPTAPGLAARALPSVGTYVAAAPG